MNSKALHIDSLHCTFKKLKDAEVTFSPGMTAIRGPNGAGKSSVLHAVLFALYGVGAVPGGKAAAVPTGESNASATLNFTLGTSSYSLERTTTAAKLYRIGADGQLDLQANGTSAVSDYVKDALGIASAQEFCKFSYSPQGETSALLTLGASALNKTVEQLAGADFVDRIVTRAKTKTDFLKGGLAQLPDAVDTRQKQEELNDATVRMAAVEQDFSAREADSERAAERLSAARVCLQRAAERNRHAREVHRSRTALERELEVSVRQHASCSEKLDSAGQPEPEVSAHDLATAKETADSLRSAGARRAELCRQRSAAERSASALSQRAADSAAVAVQLEETQTKLFPLTEQQQELKAVVSERKRAVLSLQASVRGAVCHACQRPFDADSATALEEQLAQAETELAGLQQKLAETEDKVLGLERGIATLRRSLLSEKEAAQYTGALASLETTERELASLPEVSSAELEEAEAAYQRLIRQAAQREAAMATLQQLTAEKAKHEAAISASEKALQELPELAEEDETPLHAEEKAAMEEAAVAAAVLAALQSEFSQLEARARGLESEIQQAQAADAKRKALEERVSVLGALVKFLTQNKARYLTGIWDGITATVSEFVSSVTGGGISSLSRDESGEFWFIENGEQRPIFCASGGQRAIIGVGMRLALGNLQPAGAGLLLLDEPSAELADETAAALAGALRAQDRQIVLVTHRSGDEFSADKTVMLGATE